jgi:hypothetical protein
MKTPIMRFAVRATAILPLLCLVAAADEVPRVETYFGYSLVRFDSNGAAPTFTSNGGTAQLIYNFRPWIAVVGDFGGYHNGQAAYR